MTQMEFIEILFGDCGFNGAGRRNWLQREYGKRYADELTGAQRSEIIDRLKELKMNLKPV